MLRVRVGEVSPQLRAPASADDEYLVLVEALAEVFHQRRRVLDELLYGEVTLLHAEVRPAGAALIPRDHCERIQQVGVILYNGVPVAYARTAVQKQ